MPNENIPPARLRVIRDLMLQYLYDHGGEEKLKQEVSIDRLKKTLGLSDAEYLAGFNNLQSRRLLRYPGTPNHIGINLEGQFEVETIGSSDNQASGDAAKLRELSKRMAAQSEAREKLQAELDVYRLAPWWRRLVAAFHTVPSST
jgi:hypothetical protein